MKKISIISAVILFLLVWTMGLILSFQLGRIDQIKRYSTQLTEFDKQFQELDKQFNELQSYCSQKVKT